MRFNIKEWQEKHIKKENINEEYLETIDGKGDISDALASVMFAWKIWRSGPLTEKEDIKPAKKELINYITSFLEKKLK